MTPSPTPTWRDITITQHGRTIPRTRRFWVALEHYYNLGAPPPGYEVQLPGPVVDCLGLAEVLEERVGVRRRGGTTQNDDADAGANDEEV